MTHLTLGAFPASSFGLLPPSHLGLSLSRVSSFVIRASTFNSASSFYSLCMLAGIVVSIIFWSRVAKRDDKLLLIYICSLAGAFLGAKIVYLLSEGWLHFHSPYFWLMLATGKSILGALLGGYAAVEIAKRAVGYRGTTGDWFAMIVPLGVIIGRLGCLVNGCCLGKVCDPAWYTMRDIEGNPRWPAVPVEMIFNALALVIFVFLRRKKILTGQHFHLYLIGYGLFRFAHEFMRDTPDVFGGFSGYQIAALAVATLGFLGFERRRRRCEWEPEKAAPSSAG